jgi:hypothetical protein
MRILDFFPPPVRKKRSFVSPNRADLLWVTPMLLFSGYQEICPFRRAIII